MTANLPLPSAIARAHLPEAYQAARRALAICARVDECKDWSDKHVALASYARQSKDETLLRYALRVQARAVRRAGEILNDLPARWNQHDGKGSGAPTKRAAGAAAGMSADQTRTAMRVARVPEDEFEREIERDDPPTVRKLADLGKGRMTRPPTVVSAEALARSRALVRLKQVLRDLEDLAVDIDTLPDAEEYFARRRDPALREQCRSARLFFHQLEGWLKEDERQKRA